MHLFLSFALQVRGLVELLGCLLLVVGRIQASYHCRVDVALRDTFFCFAFTVTAKMENAQRSTK